MPCNINGCPTKGDEPNVVLYPFPQESRGTLELQEQWRQYVDQVAWRRGRGLVCSRHFPTPPSPTDFPTIDLPPDTEYWKKYPERLVLRKKVSDVEMEKIAREMLYNPGEFMDASKLKVGISGITYTKLWLLSKWRKHLSSYLIHRDAATRAIRDAPEWMRRADDELQLVHYILQKDHLHDHSSFLRVVAGSVPSGGYASVVYKYRTTEDKVRAVWHLFSCSVRMKLQWLSCRGDEWRQLPRVARLSPLEWEYSGRVIMDDDHVEWALIYSVSPLGRPTLLLLHLAKLYKLEDNTASRELRERRWAEACRVYRKSGLHCPPLLLQRRWQQLKQDARQAIAAPHKYRPHLFHWLLVCRWPHVVTAALPTWQQLRKRGFVYDLKEQDLEKLEPVEPEDTEDNEDILAFLKSIKFPDLQIDGEEVISKNLETNQESVAIASKTEMIDHFRALNSKLLKYYSFHTVTYFSNIEREHLKNEQHKTTFESKEYNLSISPLDEMSNTYSYKKIQKTQNETSNDSSPCSTDNEATEVIDTIKELESLDPRKSETTIIMESDEEMEICDDENKGQIPMDVEEYQSKKHYKEDLEMSETYPIRAFKKPRLENDSIKVESIVKNEVKVEPIVKNELKVEPIVKNELKVEPIVEDVKNEPYANTQTGECNLSVDPVFVKKEKDSDIGVNKAKSWMRLLFEDSSESCSSDAESACTADDVKVDEKLLMDTRVVLDKVDSEQYISSMNHQRASMEQPNLVNVPKSESKCILSNPIKSYTSKLISEINSEEFGTSSEPLKQAKFINEPSNKDIAEPIRTNASPMQLGSNDNSDSYSDDFKLYLSDSEPTQPIITEKTKDDFVIEPDVPSNKDIAEPIRTNANPMQLGYNDYSDSDSDDFKLYLCESDSEPTQPTITQFKIKDEFQTSKLEVSESKPFDCEYEQILTKLMQSGSEKVLSESKHILSESKQIKTESEKVQSGTENIQSESENIHSESEHIQSESEKVQSEIENIQSESDHVQSESENAPSESYESRTISGKVEHLLPVCRPLSVTLHKLSPQECAKSWSRADVGRPVSLPVRGQARLLPVAQVRPIRPDTSDVADKGGVCSLTTLQNMIQIELKDRTFVLNCCGAKRLMELVDRQLNRKSVDTVATAKQRHLEEHRERNCRCCCRWLIRDSPPWFVSLLYAQRTLRAAVAKIRKDDDGDANKHPLFDSVTLISSDDDNESEVIMKRKKNKIKYKRDRTRNRKRPKKKVPEAEEEEETRPSTGDRDYDEWMRQKTEYKRFFFIKSMIGKSKVKETTEAETQADQNAEKTQSNIAPTKESPKTQSNIAPTQKSATKTQSNIAPTQESATKTQSNIAPTQVSAPKTQSNIAPTQEFATKTLSNIAPTQKSATKTPSNIAPTQVSAPKTLSNIAPTQVSAPKTQSNIAPTQVSAPKTLSNIAPTQVSAPKIHSNIAPTQTSATKTQLNIAPTRESATKTQSNIAPTQESATKTQSNIAPTKETATKTQLNIASTQESATKTRSNIALTQESATKTQSNIAPTQESATKTQSNIALTQESATKTQSNIAPTQKSPKTQSNNFISVESETNRTIENPLLHIANIMEEKYKNAVFATSEKKAKSMAEDALELALKVTRPQKDSNTIVPLTVENVAFHTQMQHITSGPSTSANLNAPKVGKLVKFPKCLNVTPIQAKKQNPVQIVRKPKLIYLGKSINPTGQPSNRPVFKLLQKANMPQVLQNNTSSNGLNNVVLTSTNMPSVLKKYTQNYTPLEQAQENLTSVIQRAVIQNSSAVLTTIPNANINPLPKSTIQHFVSNKSLLRPTTQHVESNKTVLRAAALVVESNIKDVPCICSKNCTQKNAEAEKSSHEDVYVQIPATAKRSEPLIIKLPNITVTKRADQNLSKINITRKKYNTSNQYETLIKIKRGVEDKRAHKNISTFKTLCRDGTPIAGVLTPFVSNVVEKGKNDPILNCGTNLNSGVTDRSEVPEDDANASGRDSPDVVMITDEPELVDLTDDNDDTRRLFMSTTPEKCVVINEIIPLDAANAGQPK